MSVQSSIKRNIAVVAAALALSTLAVSAAVGPAYAAAMPFQAATYA